MDGKGSITKFIYMGDPQCSRIRGRDNDYSQWGQLLRRALVMQRQTGGDIEQEPALLILGGDLVNRKNGHAAWDAFFDAAAGISAPIQMATVVSGSEESTGRYADRFFNPGNGPAGHEKEFFSFDRGCCHFLFLDSDYMGNRNKDAYKFIGAWIKADLAVNRQPVTFAVMHHPVYTVGTSFDDDVRASAIRENYMKLLYRYGVDMILCGHQHVYARSNAQTDESAGRYEITQIMGVSGTKYFDAWDKSSMACVRENISVATLFETDGEIIKLKTIDENGTVIDEYSQHARAPKKRKCASCEHFSACQGTGRFEKIEAEKMVREGRDPLKLANTEGISIIIGSADGCDTDKRSEIFFSEAKLDGMEHIEVTYSVMRRGKLSSEVWSGFRLSQLLGRAYAEAGKSENFIEQRNPVLILTDGKGRQRALPLGQIEEAWRFESKTTESGKSVVPAMIAKEAGAYKLIIGQTDPGQYNGRDWMQDIRQIEIAADNMVRTAR